MMGNKKPYWTIFLVTVGLVTAFLIASFWATRWVNNRSFNDFPGNNELFFARKVWQVTPALNKEKDSEQARKLSWLTVQAKIYAKGKKDPKLDIINPLSYELVRLSAYYKKNHSILPPVEQYRLLVQIMTYLNRVLLYQRYSDQRVEKMLNEISPHISLMPDSELKENWYRERMINAYLVGTPHQYEMARGDYLIYLQQVSVPPNYRLGVIRFFDGIFGCISRQLGGAGSNLEVAHRELPTRFVHNLFFSDLNALMFGKGMEESSVCKPILETMIKGDS